MLTDRNTAVELASTIIISTQGRQHLKAQVPLRAEARTDCWLVKGTSYIDKRANLQYCFTFFLIAKNSARVVGLGNVGRAILSEEEARHWHEVMSEQEFERVFGPRTQFEPYGEELEQALFFHSVTYGGLINKPDHAITYAKAVASDCDGAPDIARANLRATLDGGAWSIVDVDRRVAIATIERRDCRTNFLV